MFFKRSIKTPVRLQINPVECGATCLGIVLDYYGYKNNQQQLNQLLGISKNGSDALDIIKGAQQFGLNAHAQKKSAAQIADDKKPSIIFVDDCHFVVLESIKNKNYHINDPAKGRYCLSQREFRRRFSGVEIVIEGKKQKLKRFYETGHINIFFIFAFLIQTLLILFFSSLLQGFSLEAQEKFVAIGLSFTLLAAVFFSSYGLQKVLMKKIDRHEKKFQSSFIDSFHMLNPAFFETRPFERFTSALMKLNRVDSVVAPQRLAVFLAILLTLMMGQLLLFWPFAFVLLGFLFFSFWAERNSDHTQKNFIDTLHLRALFGQFLDMDAMGQRHVLLKEQIERDVVDIRKLSNCYAKDDSNNIVHIALLLLAVLSESLIAHYFLQNGSLEHSSLLTSFCFLLMTSYAIRILTKNIAPEISHTDALIDEMNSQIRSECVYASDSVIGLHNASFGYPKEEPLFDKADLKIKKNSVYALVGEPLCGKSTLLKILGQKLNLNLGTLLSPNKDRNTIKYSLIDDDAQLFEDSLLENVRVYEHRFGERDVSQALQLACVEELFFNRSMGLLAPIERGGVNVSGGQKKRLLLARALIHQPDLILLDDFFSSLDDNCAHKILTNLNNLTSSVIFTSFKENQLAMADEIIFIDQKNIVTASHLFLMANNQRYHQLIGKVL
ncbi:MAG: ATP-binding cassette domain-containing protein [Myxococcales bacterium]|nr:ATP-binding cassette domain-containing protein [Myxococcales bacterium]USN51443.1 MAG: ATP-binding cassette domain-containing protein [Myxococcales bacterium]